MEWSNPFQRSIICCACCCVLEKDVVTEEAVNHKSVSSTNAVHAMGRVMCDIAVGSQKPYPALQIALMMGVLVIPQPVGAVLCP